MIRSPFKMLSLASLLCARAAAALPPQEASLPADFPKPFTVSISGDSLSSLLSQLSAQSQVNFTFSPRPGRGSPAAVSLNLKDVPLWDALRKIQDLTQADGNILWRIGQDPVPTQVGAPFSNAGPFLIHANAIIHNADYGRPNAEVFYLRVLALTDPGTRIVSIQHASNPAKALDDVGNSLVPDALAPADIDMVAERGGGGRRPEGVTILLQRPKAPANPGPQLRLLEGAIPATIATKIDSFRLTLPAAEHRQYGTVDAAITFNNSNVGRAGTGGYIEANISFTRPQAMSDEEWNRAAKIFSATRVRLLGPGDKPIATQAGGENTSATRRTTSVIYPRPANADTVPPQVLIEIPAETQTILIPYHFEFLPLP